MLKKTGLRTYLYEYNCINACFDFSTNTNFLYDQFAS